MLGVLTALSQNWSVQEQIKSRFSAFHSRSLHSNLYTFATSAHAEGDSQVVALYLQNVASLLACSTQDASHSSYP
eukprot:COSAG05_NODE_2371_length_3162_cov_2.346066_2_plen_75_part_00